MKRIFLASALIAASSVASAANQAYVIGSLGLASYDISEDEVAQVFIDEGFSSVQGTLDKDPGMFKIGIGVDLNENFSIEGTYTNLGTVEANGVTTGPTAAFKFEIETTGFEAAIVGKHAINEDTRLFGKVGMYAWESEIDVWAAGSGGSGIGSDSIDGTDMTFGGGLEYKAWRFEFQRYSLDDMDVDTFQVAYRFNL